MLHDYHVSTTQIQYSHEEREIKVSIKMFLDDLEASIDSNFTGTPDIGQETQHSNVDQWIQEYLLERFEIKINDKHLQLIYLGFEIEDDEIWCYLHNENTKRIKSIHIHNELLIDLFDNQSNIVQLNIGGKKRTKHFSKNRTDRTFKFKK